MFFLILVLFLLVGGALAVITLQNLDQTVNLVIFDWHSLRLPFGLWLIGAFLLGAILLYLVSIISAWGDRRELKSLRKQVAELEKEKVETANVPPQPSIPMRVPTAPLLANGSRPLTGTLPTPGISTASGAKVPTGPLTATNPRIPMPGINQTNVSPRS